MMNGGTPGFTAVFAGLLVGRRTTGPQLLGVAVGFVGIVLVSLPSLGEGSSEATGVGLVVLATVCYGVALNLVAPLQRSEEHTSELQSLMRISYAVFCLKKKKI